MGGIMKHKIIIPLLSIALILVSILGVNKYIENERYESYISLDVANKISRITTDLLQNQKIYNDIIHSDTITLEQVELLYENNYSLGKKAQELEHLATSLKRIDREDISNITANNASDIGYFFSEFIWDKAEGVGIDRDSTVYHLPYELPSSQEFTLELDEKEKIEMTRELNEHWINTVAKNVAGLSEEQVFNPDLYFKSYQDDAINSTFWVDLIVQMEAVTEVFLHENNYLTKIGTILN